MYEMALACDNLLCDGHGRPPNPTLVVDVYMPVQKTWVLYGRTEIIEVFLRSVVPSGLKTNKFAHTEKQQPPVSEHDLLQNVGRTLRRFQAEIHGV